MAGFYTNLADRPIPFIATDDSGIVTGRSGNRDRRNEPDILVVTKFDRLGKRIKGLVELLNDLQSRSVHFIAIEDGVDTRTTDGAYLVGVIARLVLMDKALVSETTQLSLAIAKAKGRTGGRPPALTEEQKMEASKLISGGMLVRAVAKVSGSNQATLYRLRGTMPV